MENLMIVDDDNTMVSLLKLLFEMDGYTVSTFTQRDSILEDIRREKPDLILMDVFISNIDGMEVLKAIRESSDIRNLKVIMSSGMDLEQKCISAGADSFLLKPYPPEELMQMISDLLPGREKSQFVEGKRLD